MLYLVILEFVPTNTYSSQILILFPNFTSCSLVPMSACTVLVHSLKVGRIAVCCGRSWVHLRSSYKQQDRFDSCVFMQSHSWYTRYTLRTFCSTHATPAGFGNSHRKAYFQLTWLTLILTFNVQWVISRQGNHNLLLALVMLHAGVLSCFFLFCCHGDCVDPEVYIGPADRNLSQTRKMRLSHLPSGK